MGIGIAMDSAVAFDTVSEVHVNRGRHRKVARPLYRRSLVSCTGTVLTVSVTIFGGTLGFISMHLQQLALQDPALVRYRALLTSSVMLAHPPSQCKFINYQI